MKLLLLFAGLLALLPLTAQDVIRLMNPSFESAPHAGNTSTGRIQGWFDCGFSDESPPDIHLDIDFHRALDRPIFEVRHSSAEGGTFLGMVTRDNDTWESVCQRLDSPLMEGETYFFDIFLAQAKDYLSPTRSSSKKVNHNTPVKLRIWGGNTYCQRLQLLAESPLIDHEAWQEYNFVFKPAQEYNFITLEAHYKTLSLFPYSGNLLLDNCSPIYTNNSADNASFSAEETSISLQVELEEATEAAAGMSYTATIDSILARCETFQFESDKPYHHVLSHYFKFYQQYEYDLLSNIIVKADEDAVAYFQLNIGEMGLSDLSVLIDDAYELLNKSGGDLSTIPLKSLNKLDIQFIDYWKKNAIYRNGAIYVDKHLDQFQAEVKID